MGNAELKPSQISDITTKTGFTEDQVKKWFTDFRKDSGKDGVLSMEEFKQVFRTFFPHADANMLASQVFEKFDTDHNGTIDFQEFIGALGVTTNGTVEQKMKWVFKMFDLDHNKVLDRGEITNVMRAVGKMNNSPVDDASLDKRVHDILKYYDKTNNDLLTYKEFLRVVKTEPSVAELFSYDG